MNGAEAFHFLGGEPLSKLFDNRKAVIALAKEIREKFPGKTIFLWSGYLFEEILEDEDMKGILDYIDVLIDGSLLKKTKIFCLKFCEIEFKCVSSKKNSKLGSVC